MGYLSTEKVQSLTKCAAILGAFLITVPSGVPYFYANLSAYTDSYFMASSNCTLKHLRTDLIPSMFMASQSFSIMFGDVIIQKVGRVKSLIMSMTIFDLSLCLTYCTVGRTLYGTIFFFGVIPGLTAGISTALSYKRASELSSKYCGFVSSLVSCGQNSGALVYIAVITFFVNGKNEKPDLKIGTDEYHSQAGILERVPFVFFILAFLSMCIQVLGIHLVRLQPRTEVDSKESKKVAEEGEGYGSMLENLSEDFIPEDVTSVLESVGENEMQEAEELLEDVFDKGPLQLFTEIPFYLLWVSYAGLSLSSLMEQSYYQPFGQLYISGSGFFAKIGSTANSVCIFFRLIFGLLIDMIGVKDALVWSLSMNCVFLSYQYWIPRIDKFLYMGWVSVLSAVQTTTLVVHPMACLKFFGPEFYTMNLGVVLTAQFFVSFLCPFIFKAVLSLSSWFSLFIFAAFVSFICLLLVVRYLPRLKNK